MLQFVLRQEVNKGVRQIYHNNTANIWDDPGFVEEFRDDHLEWLAEQRSFLGGQE